MKIYFTTVLLLIALVACKNSEEKDEDIAEAKVNYEKLEQLDWILGRWSNISEETQSFERWIKNSDSLYIGTSVTLKDGDTIFAEAMRLFQERGDVKLYVETIGENPNPVTFSLAEGAENLFTFRNSNNEFPSEIVYTQPTPGKIHAWVTGVIGGNPQKSDFYFNRDSN